MERLKFPKDFLWGGAGSAEQMEGKGSTLKANTGWDIAFKNNPSLFYQGVGPELAIDFGNKWKEDIKMYKKIGANSVRLGFSWARLFLDDSGIQNKDGVEFYHNVLAELKKYSIKVVMTLHHFDLPEWAFEKGGWISKEVVQKYADYADFCFKEFGNEVDYFATMNEPIVPIHGGYLFAFHYPFLRDERKAFQASFGTILAHCRAVNIFNDKYKGKIKAKIGVVINVTNAYAKDGINFSKEDKKAAHMSDIFHNISFLDPMLLGTFPPELKKFLDENPELRPEYTNEEIIEISRVKVDFVGVNFYSPSRVQAPEDNELTEYKHQKYAKQYIWKDAVMNVFRGWEIYPKALYDVSKLIRDRYNNLPFYISENGMGVQNEWDYKDKSGIIQDDYRIAFLNEHLFWLHKAIQEGANCFGYHMWAISDNWSWGNAFKNRYGFIEVDLKTQKRTPKKSAEWLKECSTTNSIAKNFKHVQEVMDLKTVKFEKSL